MAASEFCKSMSALIKSILRLLIVLDPLKQISADLNKAKEVLALIHDIVLEFSIYCLPHFFLTILAITWL